MNHCSHFFKRETLLVPEDLMLFFVTFDIKLNIFGGLVRCSDKRSNLRISSPVLGNVFLLFFPDILLPKQISNELRKYSVEPQIQTSCDVSKSYLYVLRFKVSSEKLSSSTCTFIVLHSEAQTVTSNNKHIFDWRGTLIFKVMLLVFLYGDIQQQRCFSF